MEPKALAVVRGFLDTLSFSVQPINFDEALSEVECHDVIRKLYAKDTLGRLMLNLPDLFIMHPKLEAATGTLFVRVFEAGGRPRPGEIEDYKKYYPQRVVALAVEGIRGSQNIVIHAGWHRSSVFLSGPNVSKMRPLTEFLENDVGLRISRIQHRRLEQGGLASQVDTTNR